MLEKVKQKLSSSKEPLVPISLRIEASSKTALYLLAQSYGVKTNELIRYVFQAFIEEAWNEKINIQAFNDGQSTLGELLEFMHADMDPNVTIEDKFRAIVKDANLGD
ncbi:MAG: hypothetical protein PHV10_01425 [Sulfuricurvum sp.]|nr:hypothetical protein [Sulfuricurvum sp.]